jgi:hypothetical protein
VTNINLAANDIDTAGASALAEALKVNTSVTLIDLSDNEIGNEGTSAFPDALKVNSIVTAIDLYNSPGIGAEGAAALAEALKVNTSVTAINLWCTRIGDEGTAALAGALTVNTSVTTIHLNSNKISPKGASALADALKVNSTVTRIGIGRNAIGDEGLSALADALKVNTSVTDIFLEKNEIGDEGASALADALKVNTSVKNNPRSVYASVLDEVCPGYLINDRLEVNEHTLGRLFRAASVKWKSQHGDGAGQWAPTVIAEVDSERVLEVATALKRLGSDTKSCRAFMVLDDVQAAFALPKDDARIELVWVDDFTVSRGARISRRCWLSTARRRWQRSFEWHGHEPHAT